MFKETYGFDTDVIKRGEPIRITDDEPRQAPSSHIFSWSFNDDGMNYKYENKSGNYLILESSSTVLRLMSMDGEMVMLPIRHFLGDSPRMFMYLNNGWKD